jgi:hypothetical protein
MKTIKRKKIRGLRGGPRPNSGRPVKLDKDEWQQISIFLRRDTILKLRKSATRPGDPLSKRFGKYLQWHLDRYAPLEDYEVWQQELEYEAREAARKAAAPPLASKRRISRADRAILKELRDALAADKLKARNRGTPQLSAK